MSNTSVFPRVSLHGTGLDVPGVVISVGSEPPSVSIVPSWATSWLPNVPSISSVASGVKTGALGYASGMKTYCTSWLGSSYKAAAAALPVLVSKAMEHTSDPVVSLGLAFGAYHGAALATRGVLDFKGITTLESRKEQVKTALKASGEALVGIAIVGGLLYVGGLNAIVVAVALPVVTAMQPQFPAVQAPTVKAPAVEAPAAEGTAVEEAAVQPSPADIPASQS